MFLYNTANRRQAIILQANNGSKHQELNNITVETLTNIECCFHCFRWHCRQYKYDLTFNQNWTIGYLPFI